MSMGTRPLLYTLWISLNILHCVNTEKEQISVAINYCLLMNVKIHTEVESKSLVWNALSKFTFSWWAECGDQHTICARLCQFCEVFMCVLIHCSCLSWVAWKWNTNQSYSSSERRQKLKNKQAETTDVTSVHTQLYLSHHIYIYIYFLYKIKALTDWLIHSPLILLLSEYLQSSNVALSYPKRGYQFDITIKYTRVTKKCLVKMVCIS